MSFNYYYNDQDEDFIPGLEPIPSQDETPEDDDFSLFCGESPTQWPSTNSEDDSIDFTGEDPAELAFQFQGIPKEDYEKTQTALETLHSMPNLQGNQQPDQGWNGVPSATVYMPFGKHTGEIPWNIESDYLAWACRTIPLYFYSFYLPRFTQEAGKEWINWWEEIYGETLNQELKESRMNMRPNKKDYPEITEEIQLAFQKTKPTKGNLCKVFPVKARKNIFQIHGTKQEVLRTLTQLNQNQKAGEWQEIVILCATKSPKNTITVEFLHRKYQPKSS